MNHEFHNTTGTAARPAATAWLTGAAIALLLAGCTSGGTPMTSPPSTPRPSMQTAAPQPGTTPSAGTDTDVPAERWAAILGDLTKRGVATDSVALVSSRSLTWNDGSLGCPAPGKSYTQALVPGMQVVVNVAGTEYDYRFGRADTPKLCER